MLMENIEKIISGPSYPEKGFIISEYTYDEVYKIASELKQLFKSNNLKDDVICLFTENKALIAATILATIENGPEIALPFAYSKQAFFEMHGVLGFNAVIVDKEIEMPEGITLLKPEISKSSDYLRPDISFVDPDREFVHFYTGGSTGKPQRWSKSLKNLFSEAISHAAAFHISEADTFLATVPPYHIYGFLWSVLIPFVSSASVVANVYTYPHEIVTAIQKNNVSVFVSVPMHYRLINGNNLNNHYLRLAFSSAGTLDIEDGVAFTNGSGVCLHEIYGSTETGGIASRCRAEGDIFFTPFAHVDWYIKNEQLFVRSDGISSGVDKNQEGFFHLGDRVFQINDNSFELLGRSDGVVKVGGRRVELNMICEKMKSLPDVTDVVVISLPTKTGRENMIAALVVGDNEGFDKHYIRQKLSSLLEPYAIPRIIRVVEKIPATATGKYDRIAIEQLLQETE